MKDKRTRNTRNNGLFACFAFSLHFSGTIKFMRINGSSISEVILTWIGVSLIILGCANPVWARDFGLQQECSPTVVAQNADSPELLQLLNPIERKLGGDQSHDYLLKVDQGTYFRIDVDQKGIDVVVELSGPDGKKIAEVDSLNGITGLESIVFIADAGGSYKISVRSPQAGVAPGAYVIVLSDLKTAGEREQKLLSLYRKYREAVDWQTKAQLKEALEAATAALKLAEDNLGQRHSETALVLITLAEIHRSDGRSEQAEALFRKSLDILEGTSGTQRVLLAQAWEGLGNTLFGRGNLSEAEKCYRQAIAVREQIYGKDSPDIVVILGSLAQVSLERGDLGKAEGLFKRTLTLYEGVVGINNQAAVNFLNNYAELYRALADYPQAEKLYQKALSIQEGLLGKEHSDYAHTLGNIAGLYFEMGDTERAERLREQALSLLERIQGPTHPMVALASSNLGLVLFHRGEAKKAEQLLRRALDIYEHSEFKEDPSTARVLVILGEVLQQKGDLAGAEELYRRALTINRKAYGDRHPDVAAVTIKLSKLAYLHGDFATAESLDEQALKTQESVFGSQHPSVIYTLGDLASLSLARGDLPRAIELYRRVMEVSELSLKRNIVVGAERQKLAYLSTFGGQLNKVVTLHARFAPDNPQAMNLALSSILRRKVRALDEIAGTITAIRSRSDSGNEELLKQWLALRSQLSALALRGPADADFSKYTAHRREVEEQLEKVEAELSRNADFQSQAKPVTPEAVQMAIPPKTSLIEYVLYLPYDPKTKATGAPRYVAYVINSKGEPRWAELGEASTIDRAITRFSDALRDKQRNDVREKARRLDRMVMQPLRKLIGDSTRILVSPDGQLNLVPFAALADENNQWLVKRYSFTYLTSGRDLLRPRAEKETGDEVVVVADPAFNGAAPARLARSRRIRLTPKTNKQGSALSKSTQVSLDDVSFDRLPGTAREAEAISEMIPAAKVLTGENASKERLTEIHHPRILHIATHGFFLPGLQTDLAGQAVDNPLLRSGLALAGANARKEGDNRGVLTALEVAGLDLWGTKLVVLSACDTGVGEIRNGDGVHGLRRALVLAGSETQIMTLWPVSDLGTTEMMMEYYRRLLKGAGRGDSLREAQLQLLRNPRRQRPFYWAGFIQSGEWTGINGKRD